MILMILWRLFKFTAILFFLAFLFIGGWIGFYFIYPDVTVLAGKNPEKTSFMAVREQEWAEKGKKITISYRWVPLAEISTFLVDAVLISEDDKFWNHEGFDIEGMQKALERDLKAGTLTRGGSTITQQLAKNLYLSPERSAVRKAKEAIITWRLEKALSKKRILELYLNVAEWGEGIFGAEAAARHYYKKPATQLSPEEAAHLAAALPNPRKYSPVGKSRFVANRFRIIFGVMEKRDKGMKIYQDLLNSPEPKE